METYTSLPTGISQWSKCVGWDNADGTATPDYFHIDGSGDVELPYTLLGSVYPHSGDAILGIGFRYNDDSDPYREYIDSHLSEPMIAGSVYQVSLWLTNGFDDWFAGAGSNRFGIRFSKEPLEQDGTDFIDIVPQIEIEEELWLTDWTYFEFSFIADSAYEYITYGNFYDNGFVSWTVHDFSAYYQDASYYFIDDVAVIPINMTVVVDTSICEGETYTLPDGEIVAESLIDTTILTGVDGTDSIVITYLTVLPISTSFVLAEICEGETYLLPGGSIATAPGTYADTLLSAAGCDSIIITTLTVHPLYFLSSTVERCIGEVYVLPDGTTVDVSGIYTVTFTSINGCDSTISTELIIHPLPELLFTPEEIVCIEVETYNLTASPPGGIFTGSGVSGNIFYPAIAGVGAHEITYSYTSPEGCSNSISAFITVDENYADAGSDITLEYGETGMLDGDAGGDYTWSPPEGLNCTDCEDPEVTGLIPTTYTLVSENINGCIASDDVLVIVNGDAASEVFIPNTFTPNGDGMNDLFFIYGAYLKLIEQIAVYDRWGELIYLKENINATDNANGWDGTYHGKPLNEGVYAYTARVVLVSGQVWMVAGNITLIR